MELVEKVREDLFNMSTNKWYLQNKWSWTLAAGGINARCPISGKLISHGGEYHHILHRPSADNEIYRLASDVHLCILLSHEEHAKYHDRDTSNAQKDVFFQASYKVWGMVYGSVDEAYRRTMEAYNALQSAMTTRMSYVPPKPIVALQKWAF